MNRKSLPENFASLAVASYDKTYRAMFQQANEEVNRLGRINVAMRALEERLLNVDVIRTMDTIQQVTLFEILSRSQQTTIRNVMGFGTVLRQVRGIVAVHDGLVQDSAIEGESEPVLEMDYSTMQLLESDLEDDDDLE